MSKRLGGQFAALALSAFFAVFFVVPLLADDEEGKRIAVAKQVVEGMSPNWSDTLFFEALWIDLKFQLEKQNAHISPTEIASLRNPIFEKFSEITLTYSLPYVDLLANSFTVQELLELRAFYYSNVGRKLTKLQPEIFRVALQQQSAILRANADEIRNQLLGIVSNLGYRVED